jgi:hypothetical protein
MGSGHTARRDNETAGCRLGDERLPPHRDCPCHTNDSAQLLRYRLFGGTEMGDFRLRSNLINDINQAFSAANIAATLNRLGTLSPRDDCLSIVDKLGFLTPIHGGDLRGYRRIVGIPLLHQRILTAAFRTALLNRPAPIALKIDIVTGQAEAVSVTTDQAGLTILLTRLPLPAAPAAGP